MNTQSRTVIARLVVSSLTVALLLAAAWVNAAADCAE